jgi:8-oxo-dGTP pyrophosphatase MutT (NUDIX family)
MNNSLPKFTNLKPKKEVEDKENNIAFSNNHIKVINFEDWTFVKESDMVVCIVYLVETNQIILRHEYIPTFKYRDGQEFHVTVLSGGIEQGESPERAILREIEEEAGIVIDPDYKVEFMKPLFVSKVNSAKYHPCIIQLTETQYHEVIAKGDGSEAEKKSQSVKVDVRYLNSLNASDLITEYMIGQMKDYLNIQ